MLIPSYRHRSIAGHPARVPGILTIVLERFTARQRRRASATVASVSSAIPERPRSR